MKNLSKDFFRFQKLSQIVFIFYIKLLNIFIGLLENLWKLLDRLPILPKLEKAITNNFSDP